jgi:hypothetical protein
LATSHPFVTYSDIQNFDNPIYPEKNILRKSGHSENYGKAQAIKFVVMISDNIKLYLKSGKISHYLKNLKFSKYSYHAIDLSLFKDLGLGLENKSDYQYHYLIQRSVSNCF